MPHSKPRHLSATSSIHPRCLAALLPLRWSLNSETHRASLCSHHNSSVQPQGSTTCCTAERSVLCTLVESSFFFELNKLYQQCTKLDLDHVMFYRCRSFAWVFKIIIKSYCAKTRFDSSYILFCYSSMKSIRFIARPEKP